MQALSRVQRPQTLLPGTTKTPREPGTALPKDLAIAMVSSRPMSGTTASPAPRSWAREGRGVRAGSAQVRMPTPRHVPEQQGEPTACQGLA